MKTVKIFLASSSELKEDRDNFKQFLYDKTIEWKQKDILLEIVRWEEFLDSVSATRLQDEYNKAIAQCDIFVMLFYTKVGKYTFEEFETAFNKFKATGRPAIYTYFKDTGLNTNIKDEDQQSLNAFKSRLENAGHFPTKYNNTQDLLLKFSQQLERLISDGFIKDGNKIRSRKKWIITGVITLLVLVIFWITFSNYHSATNVTVFVHGKAGIQDLVLKLKGDILMDVGAERKKESIDAKGKAVFQNVKVGEKISLDVDFSEPYHPTKRDSIYTVKKDDKIYLEVALPLDSLFGKVYDDNDVLENVIVSIGRLRDTTDIFGNFELKIPEELQQPAQKVTFYKPGYETTEEIAYPQTKEALSIVMKKKK